MTLPVEMYDLFSVLLEGDGATFAPAGFGLGSLTLDDAGATDGAPVSGSFDIELYWP